MCSPKEGGYPSDILSVILHSTSCKLIPPDTAQKAFSYEKIILLSKQNVNRKTKNFPQEKMREKKRKQKKIKEKCLKTEKESFSFFLEKLCF